MENTEFASTSTPMMRQYLSIKSEYKDCLLLYRLGDFYELFFDDAIIASKILDITLTKRGKLESQNIPMCGIPFHASELYLPKLIQANYKIAICEQLETPAQAKSRGYKEIVKREVVRIITPGTITEENLLDSKTSNYLCAITKEEDFSLAWTDISTGEFYYSKTHLSSLAFDLTRIDPKEILISDSLLENKEIYNILTEFKNKITSHVSSFFDYKRATLKLKTYYQVEILESFDIYSKSSIAACGAILEYFNLTQKSNAPILAIPKKLNSKQFMILDSATKRSLELTMNISCEKKGSLISVIDKTITNGGGRLLSNYLSSPLIDKDAINMRLSRVEFFLNNQNLSQKLREILENIGDIERATLRLVMNRGGPRDLNLIKSGLTNALILAELLEYSGISLPSEIISLTHDLAGHSSIIKELDEAIKEQVGMLARDGNFIKPDYHPKLKELSDIQKNSKEKIEEFKEKYRKETGITNLKIEQNNVIGYYIEVSPQQSSKIQADKFIHRQTLITGIRYTTLELKELESNITYAKESILRIELAIFNDLITEIDKIKDKIFRTSHSISTIDLSIAFAKLALESNYTKPIITDDNIFDIKEGRHPVVEYNFKSNSDHFIANDCNLTEDKNLWLLTGPNMAGKSTFLRQNAIIAILAQIGSYVPASVARIGIIDRIFSRVGASDDLAHGKSTFMVEMVETATILNQATERSLLILDEIGRGTSTFDGLSIAWSALEYIHNKIRARTIFATHYHELTSLTHDLSRLICYSMKIKEWEDKIVFLHKVTEGSANKSYGIHVAKIAGIPMSVIERAKYILSNFEDTKTNKPIEISREENFINISTSKVEEELRNLDLNNITPLEAFKHLERLKELVK